MILNLKVGVTLMKINNRKPQAVDIDFKSVSRLLEYVFKYYSFPFIIVIVASAQHNAVIYFFIFPPTLTIIYYSKHFLNQFRSKW